MVDVDRILLAVQPSTCLLDPYLSCLVKASREVVGGNWGDIINVLLSNGSFPSSLKERVEKKLLGRSLLVERGLANCHPLPNFSISGKGN